MKKILFASLMIALFLIAGCSTTQKCWERDVKYTEMKKVKSEVCKEREIDLDMSITESKIDPIPNQANRQYDVGTIKFYVLNKEKDLGGDFEAIVEFETSKLGLVKETKAFNLQAGERKDISILHDGRNSGVILHINQPVIVFEGGEEICEEVITEEPVEKIRKETVCE